MITSGMKNSNKRHVKSNGSNIKSRKHRDEAVGLGEINM